MAGVRLLRGRGCGVSRHLRAVGRRAWTTRRRCWTSTSPRASRTSASTWRNPKAPMSRQLFGAGDRAGAVSADSLSGSGRWRGRAGIRFIREIDGMLPRIFRPEEAPMSNPQVEPFGMLNVDCHGNVSSFSPGVAGTEERRTTTTSSSATSTRTRWRRWRRSAPMRRMARDIARRRRGVPAGLRIFFGLRRRRAGQQVGGERQLRQRADAVLRAYPHGADRPYPWRDRAGGAKRIAANRSAARARRAPRRASPGRSD